MIIFKSIYQLFYPQVCLSCGLKSQQSKMQVCSSCLIDLDQAKFYLDPLKNDLEKLFWGRVDIKNTFTAYRYMKGNAISKLVQGLKYKNKPHLGIEMGKMMAKEIQQYATFLVPDAFIPMPLHPKKKFKRGYNQSEKLCEGLSEVINAPTKNDLLIRKKHNVTQTKKHQFERWDNVADIFEVKKVNNIQHVILVDDVVTTGATLESAANALLKNGYIVSIATFAITTHS